MQCMEIFVAYVAGGCGQVGRGNSVSYYEQFSVLITYNEFSSSFQQERCN